MIFEKNELYLIRESLIEKEANLQRKKQYQISNYANDYDLMETMNRIHECNKLIKKFNNTIKGENNYYGL